MRNVLDWTFWIVLVLATTAAAAVVLDSAPAGGKAELLENRLKPINRERSRQRAQIRLVASDTFEPVAGAEFRMILIGRDGGDGGFKLYSSNQDGEVVTGQLYHAGRYQIYIDPPAGSRYIVTQYHSDGDYLVVREDGSCFPSEFKVAVAPIE